MRNEPHFWLKWLHRLVQYSRFFLESDQNYLCLMETQEEWRILSCSFTDEVQRVAHPVGRTTFGGKICSLGRAFTTYACVILPMVLQEVELEREGSSPHFCVFGPSAASMGKSGFAEKLHQKEKCSSDEFGTFCASHTCRSRFSHGLRNEM